MKPIENFAAKLFGAHSLAAGPNQQLSEEERRRINSNAWLDAGLAMMANSGYSRTPQTLGQIVAQGIGAGRQSAAVNGQMAQESMARQQQAQQEAQQRQQWEAMLASMPPEQAALYRLFTPQEGSKTLAEQRGRVLLEETKARLKPTETFRDLDPAEARRRGYDPTKAWQINEQTGRVMQVGGNGVQVTNNLPGAASPFAKALATQDAESFRGWRDAAMSAGNTLDQLQVIEQINGLQQGGKVGEAATIIGRYFGTDAAANQQIFDAAQKNLVLEQAKSLKGAMSDRDIELLESTLPRFGNDPRANAVILDILKRAANKTISNFEAAESNVAQKGDLQGFRPQMRATPATIPTNAAAVNLDALTADEIAAELRRRGIQ